MSLITNGLGNVNNSAIYKFDIKIKKCKFDINKKVIYFKVRKAKL